MRNAVYDYLIIGAGISGVAIARLLQQRGVNNILVLEESDAPGGLCRTKQVGSHVLDVGGGHFFCTKHKDVYDFIFSHFPESNFNQFDRVSKIDLYGNIIDYPIESNIWQLPVDEQIKYLISVARNGEARGLPAPETFEGWVRWKLGDEIADRYMIPYNEKIWGVSPSELDVDWLHKIPAVDIEAILRTSLKRASDPSFFPSHDKFYYPKAGGYQAVFDAIALPVKDLIQTGVPVRTIDQADGLLIVNGQYKCKTIINTAPWHNLVTSPIFPSSIVECIEGLRNNSIVVSLHDQPYKTDAHWTYIPSRTVLHHREFYIHNFAPHSDRNGVYREANVKRWESETSCLYSHMNEYAYPIPAIGRAKYIKSILEWGSESKIYGLGRWGQWEYFNSDVCIKEAMILSRRLLEIGS